MRAFILGSFLALVSSALALTPNLPAGTLGPDMVVQTRLGSMSPIIYAPRPVIPHVAAPTRGVYAIDLMITTGAAYDVRVVQSAGDKALDEVVMATHRTWRLKPRIIHKLIVPIAFHGKHVTLGATR